MTTTAGPGAGQPALRRLDCPRCGASVPQFTPDAQVIVCRSCHANLTEGIDGLRWTTGARLPRSRLPVHLGQQIILDGAPMLVLGRVRYQGWELGEPDERWTWDEWLLAAPDGRMPWLVHDEHGVSLFTRARLNAPFDPAHDSQIAVGTGRLFRVTASYTTQVVGVEGELTSRVAAGDRLTTVEGRRADRWCSVQQSESELECYEGRRLTPDEVTRALGSHATAVLRPARPPLAVVGGVLTLFALLGLLLAAAAAGLGKGTVLVSRQLTLRPGVPLPISVGLEHPGRPVRLETRLLDRMSVNTFNDLEVTVTSPDGSDTVVALPEFWHENGSDDEGYWEEQQDAVSSTFVPTQRGAHTIELELDPEGDLKAARLELVVRDRYVWPMPLLVFAGVAGAIGLVLLYLAAKAAGWLPEED
ncbi:MAG: DUF4178 domain-containing protein [Kineosporiaceae bacterium]